MEKQIFKALLKAQKQMQKVHKDKANPYFKSKYADINNFLEVSKKPLNDNGLILLQPMGMEPEPYVETLLIHESGESVSGGKTPIRCAKPNDPQALGSAITYARRYSLQSMLAMEADDDDGEKAMVRKATEPQLRSINEKRMEKGIETEDLKELVRQKFGLDNPRELTVKQANELIEIL